MSRSTPQPDEPGSGPAGASGDTNGNPTDSGTRDVPDGDAAAPTDPHTRYARTLTPEERQLLRLRDELYERSWDRMLVDLTDRLKGRPYIFKLVHRIEEDISRVQKLQSYELKHRIDLVDYLEAE